MTIEEAVRPLPVLGIGAREAVGPALMDRKWCLETGRTG